MRKKITLLVVCFCSKHIVQSMQITDIKMVTSSKAARKQLISLFACSEVTAWVIKTSKYIYDFAKAVMRSVDK